MKLTRITGIVLGVIIIAGAAIAYILYVSANPELYTLDAAARKKAGGNYIQLSDGITHYELGGPDTGKLVVLVHGFSVPYYIWDSSFTFLVKEGYRVLRYDCFGRGFSDRPDKPYEAALFRNQLAELLDKLNIRSVYALAGISFGGPVVTDFVLHNKEKVYKLILVDPVYPGLGQPPGTEGFLRYKMALAPEEMVRGQLTDLKYPSRFPNWGEQYKVQMQYRGFRNALVSTRFHYAPANSIRDNYIALDSLHKPVLLIWGEDDHTVPFRYADSLRQLLQVDYFPVPDAGHLPQMEKAAEVNRKILAFLQ